MSKRVVKIVDDPTMSKKVMRRTTSPPPGPAPSPSPPPESAAPATNWNQLREKKIRDFVLDSRGLQNLKEMAELESSGEMDDDEDTVVGEEAEKELKDTIEAWGEYLTSCAKHSCGLDGLDQWTAAQYEADCTEGGVPVFYEQGPSHQEEYEGVVDAITETDARDVRQRDGNEGDIQGEDGKILRRRKAAKNELEPRTDSTDYNRNTNIILFLCKHRAFSEAQAMEILTRSPEGIEFICSKQYAERIKNYIHIARILVFSESVKQRFERAKELYAIENPTSITDEAMDASLGVLHMIMKENNIEPELFAKTTFYHFTQQSGKKNNLFFYGPPSTGKTMIMSSLVECHFNYCRLTGLTPNSSFNFSGLLHTNAVFMDECKLKENQFEQWKLLASGMPMSTDVKYKDRCDISNCILYTCSNYPIETYCKVPMAREAVQERTLMFEFRFRLTGYRKVPPQIWEKFWDMFNLRL